MSGNGHYGNRAKACEMLHLGGETPYPVTGVDVTAKLTFLQSYRTDQLCIDLPGTGVQHLTGGEDGILADSLTCKHIHEGIGHEKNLIGNLQGSIVIPAHGSQLE